MNLRRNAKMNASAPIDPTSAWPMWIQVVIRFVMGVMSGSPARNDIRASFGFCLADQAEPVVSGTHGVNGALGFKTDLMISAPTPIDLPYDIAAALIGIVLVGVAIFQWRRDRATRSPEELVNRRRNYFPLALVLGIAVWLIPDVVVETIPSHHIDEYVDYALGAVALVWLLWPGLRFRPIAIWPVIAGLALLTNLGGILIEHNEPDDVGGDYLTFSLMAVGIAMHLYRLRRWNVRSGAS